MAAIGKRIKKRREERQLTQEQLAEQLHVTRQAVSNWENAKTQPDIDTLLRLAEVLELPAEELLYGEKRDGSAISDSSLDHAKKGIGFGVALAMVISYVNWHSIGWAILHGALNWFYVIYFVLKYGW